MTRSHLIFGMTLTAAAVAVGMLCANPAQAQSITGGGTGGGSSSTTWSIVDSSSVGFNINDAIYTDSAGTNQGDAFDTALVTSVNGTFVGTGASTRNGQFVSLTDNTSVAGLSIFKQFYVSPTLPVLRTYLTLTNTTGATLTNLIVGLQTNVGSDSATQIITSSSGDTVFTTADRYLVTDDNFTTTGDPANTHVLYGVGGLAPTSVGTTVTIGSADPDGVQANFTLSSLASGETAAFLFFNRLDGTAAAAAANASFFDSNQSIQDAGLLTGLSQTDLGQVRNFNFSGTTAAAPEPGSLPLVALGILPLVGTVTRRRKA